MKRTDLRRRAGVIQSVLLPIALIFALRPAAVYPYWPQGTLEAREAHPVTVRVGTFRTSWLPSRIPPELLEILDRMEIDNRNPAVDAVLELIDDPHYSGHIVLAETVEALFENGAIDTVHGDVILYTMPDGDGGTAVIAISVVGATPPSIASVQDLERLLNEPWSGFNHITPIWLSTNRYTLFSMPVEQGGAFYLPLHDGATGKSPSASPGEWFALHEDLAYDARNTYPVAGYFVRFGETELGLPRFYCSSGYANPGVTPAVTWAWREVEEWQADVPHAARQAVWTGAPDAPRFWLALQANDTPPDETSAAAGLWQEISNGWIAAGPLSNHYFEHNTYAAGTTVIYGASVTLHNRYCKAIVPVPAGCPPVLYDDNGTPMFNDTYWQEYR